LPMADSGKPSCVCSGSVLLPAADFWG